LFVVSFNVGVHVFDVPLTATESTGVSMSLLPTISMFSNAASSVTVIEKLNVDGLLSVEPMIAPLAEYVIWMFLSCSAAYVRRLCIASRIAARLSPVASTNAREVSS
jgi:hypothetical protein